MSAVVSGGPDPRIRALLESRARGIATLLSRRLEARDSVHRRLEGEADSSAQAADNQRQRAEETRREADSLHELARERAADAQAAASAGDPNAASLRTEAEDTRRKADKLAREASREEAEADELEEVAACAVRELDAVPPGAACALRELRILRDANRKPALVLVADQTPPVFEVQTLGGARPFSTNEIAVHITQRAYCDAKPGAGDELHFVVRQEAMDARFVPVE